MPDSLSIDAENKNNYQIAFSFPVVAKPIRGRGSQGVPLAHDQATLNKILDQMFEAELYGTSVYIEPFLAGQEITITVMPSGYIFR